MVAKRASVASSSRPRCTGKPSQCQGEHGALANMFTQSLARCVPYICTITGAF